jgi:dTDP-4-amino-4,6-dideoxygalactose transaminase
MVLFEKRASVVLEKVLKKLKQNNSKQKFLLPLNVCPIVPDTFLKADIKFEFVDISLKTLCMKKSIILEKIKNDKTITGVLFVKTFGIDIDIKPLFRKIKSINKDIFIIDDMCPCVVDFDYDIKNSYANMALFSTGYSKFVDIGYGGFGFLKDKEFEGIFKDKQNTNKFQKYKKNIKKQTKLMKIHKKKLNDIYKKQIPKKFHLGDKFNGWRFSILVKDKDKILKQIFKKDNLFASSHYPQVDFDYVKNPAQNSNTHKIHSHIINLFNDFRFTPKKAKQESRIVNSFF